MAERIEFIRYILEGMRTRDMRFQSDLARKMGVTESVVSRVLNGDANAGDVFYAGLADAFHVSLLEVEVAAGKIKEADVLKLARTLAAEQGEYFPQAQDWSLRLRALNDASRRATIAAMESNLLAVELAQSQQPSAINQ